MGVVWEAYGDGGPIIGGPYKFHQLRANVNHSYVQFPEAVSNHHCAKISALDATICTETHP